MKAEAAAAAADARAAATDLKKTGFKIIPALLAAVMLLTGCGETQNAQSVEEENPAPGTMQSQEPLSTPVPEFSWKSESVRIQQSDEGFVPLCFAGGCFYGSSFEKTGEKIPDEIIKAAKENDEEVFNDGRYDVYETRLGRLEDNGTVTRLAKYAQLPAARNAKAWEDFSSTTGLDGLCLGEDGKLYTLEHIFTAGYSKAEDGENGDGRGMVSRFEAKWYLRSLDNETGRILSKKEIKCGSGKGFSGKGMRMYEGALLALELGEEGNAVAVINTNGEIEKEIPFGGRPDDIIMLSSGRPAAVGSDDNFYGIYGIDVENGTLTELYELSDTVRNVSSGSGGFSFFYSDGLSYYGWKDETGEKLFDWPEVYVNSDRIISEIVTDEGSEASFITGSAEGGHSEEILFNIRQEKFKPESERRTVSVASRNADYALRDAVAEFNRENADCVIRVTDDFENADIIDLTGLNWRLMAAEGKLEDLYTFIDRETDFGRENMLSNILVGLEVDGKLCTTCALFSVDTVIGPVSTVGENGCWTYDRYRSTVDSLDEGVKAFDSFTTREEIFKLRLAMELNGLIDWSGRTCSFDSEKFENLLKFAAEFPENAREAGSSQDTDIAAGRQLLLRSTLYSFDDAQIAGFEFTEPTDYIGYPVEEGAGNAINIMTLESGANFGINAGSANKNAAWRFLRRFYTEEYQKGRMFFPVNTAVFDSALEEKQEVTYILDSKGNIKTDSEGEPLIKSSLTMYLSDYTPVPVYPITEQEGARLTKLVSTADKITDYNADVYRIVSAAVKPYFNGSVTVYAAASAAQDAVSNWLAQG